MSISAKKGKKVQLSDSVLLNVPQKETLNRITSLLYNMLGQHLQNRVEK